MSDAVPWGRSTTPDGLVVKTKGVPASSFAAGDDGRDVDGRPGERADRPPRRPPRGNPGLPSAISVRHRRHAELALLDGRHRLRAELVVHEDVAMHVLRLTLGTLHLVA